MASPAPDTDVNISGPNYGGAQGGILQIQNFYAGGTNADNNDGQSLRCP